MVRLLTTAFVVSALFGAGLLPADAQTKRAMTFLDIVELPTLADPQLSPDGKQVLFVMNKADWKANRQIGHIYRINTDGTNQMQLTFGERGESNPAWSPDGRTIAFTARRDADQHDQIYLLDTDGGEARRLITHGAAAANLTWATDGKSLFFTASDAKLPDEREKERVQDDVYSYEETNFKQRHLWLTDLHGKTKKLTDGDFSVESYSLSADGKRIVMQRAASPLIEHGPTGELWVANADGSGAVQLTRNTIAESNAALSPDGSTVAFTAGANEKFESYYNGKIFVMPATGGDARVLLPEVAYGVDDVAWTADGKSLLFTANMGVHNELMKVDVATKEVATLTSDEHSLGHWSYVDSAKMHIFTRNMPTRPSEVYTLQGDSFGEPRRVTNVFEFIGRQFKLARQHRLTWKGQDGQAVEGMLYYPVDYVAGQRYPLIVSTHGGPQASDKWGFSSDVQVYAGKGYAVLKPNYRGSTGYGDAFLRDMVGGYFRQSHLDVITGVDAVIAMGLADPDKLVKMGWSAGGHMTNKLITFTDRFKAASSGAGAANWISMYAQSDTRAQRTPWFGGTPWQANAPIDLYWAQSPLKDVSKVNTPTLFLVGAEDPRVPMPQSIEMWRGLKSHGVPTKLYIAPREGHGWTELRHRLFKFQIEMEWFEKWVNNKSYVWEKAPGDDKDPRGRLPVPSPPS
ncbi:MAG TPA: S9 family peptidase [Vicinamibacterales bacterium]|nr:S9 family peptidase [Vicinamibacterales bacterium]